MEKYSFGQELKENHEMTELELYRKAVVEKDGYKEFTFDEILPYNFKF